MQTITVNLEYPITDGTKTIDTLTFRRPKTGDSMMADAVTGEMSKLTAVLCGMSGITMQVAKQIDMADFTKIVTELAPFLGESKGSLTASNGST